MESLKRKVHPYNDVYPTANILDDSSHYGVYHDIEQSRQAKQIAARIADYC